MKFYRIKNLVSLIGGEIDYKGMDISKFVCGSQAYTTDMSACVVATNEETTINHADVTELTESDYITQRDEIRKETNVLPQKTAEELQENLETVKQQLAQAEADNLTTLEALAEVYEMLLALQA